MFTLVWLLCFFLIITLVLIARYNPALLGQNQVVGLTQGQLNRLGIKLFSQEAGNVERGDETRTTCLICMENFSGDHEIIELPECHHVFHAKCAQEWLQRNATCPYCRNDVRAALTTDPAAANAGPRPNAQEA
eukprot:TRINITY_DN11628_c0_g1_i2.p1 TRINITY_DN11628_c0_g1~~TRINITY_DN11628_c0_g1_i2.p1  ORF type:complete len:133 (+),score=15.07 TRINITY_DN11628_c0_g1_i2:80-478(+)